MKNIIVKTNDNLLEKVKKLPLSFGCYYFLNDKNIIIYVGKAINLQKRVNSYFKKVNNIKTMQLVREIKDIKYILTNNEKEALILEYNLIKKNRPRYNILLSDDKKYPYIVITKDKNPKIHLVYNRVGKYYYEFGPFPDGTKAKEILKILKRLYPLKPCNEKNKPCTYYQIGQCLGGCFKEVDPIFYKKNINEIKKILNGNTFYIKQKLINKMNLFASNFQFEEANKIKNLIQKFDFFTESQVGIISRISNVDYVGVFSNLEFVVISIFFYRDGKLLSKDNKMFGMYDNNKLNILRNYLLQLYTKNIKPKKLIISSDFKNYDFQSIFDFKILIAKNKEDKMVIKNVLKEAKQFLITNLINENVVNGKEIILLNQLKELCNLKRVPFLFEIYDIANLKQEAQTAGVLVYKNGLPEFNQFRHYKLPLTLKSDYGRMQELVNLRYNKKKINNKIPDLIIVDGGIIQINAVLSKIPKDIKTKIDIIGLVKDKKHNTDHIIDINKNIINIKSEPTLFNYLTLIQERVHIFSITHFKKIRSKNLLKSN